VLTGNLDLPALSVYADALAARASSCWVECQWPRNAASQLYRRLGRR
jgi:hypothetical protein